MQLIMQQPWTSIGSDGSAVNPDGPTGRTHPHPRYYGTFPRVLGRYVRELKAITLPDAVKKMTSMNADKIGIKDRGRLKEGLVRRRHDLRSRIASSIAPRSSNRTSFRSGIKYVIVNGVVTIDNGQHTGALAGRVIYGPGSDSLASSSRFCEIIAVDMNQPRDLRPPAVPSEPRTALTPPSAVPQPAGQCRRGVLRSLRERQAHSREELLALRGLRLQRATATAGSTLGSIWEDHGMLVSFSSLHRRI